MTTLDIKEISGKITGSFGGYGVFILLGAVALVFISNLGSSDNSETLQAPTGYSAYPDSVTNANVIIGEVNDHTTAEIKNLGDTMSETIGANHDEVMEKIDTSTSSITEKMDTSTDKIIKSNTEQNTTLINKVNNIQQSTNKLQNNDNSIMSQLKDIKKTTNKTNVTAKKTLSKTNKVIKKENRILKKTNQILKKTKRISKKTKR